MLAVNDSEAGRKDARGVDGREAEGWMRRVHDGLGDPNYIHLHL